METQGERKRDGDTERGDTGGGREKEGGREGCNACVAFQHSCTDRLTRTELIHLQAQ